MAQGGPKPITSYGQLADLTAAFLSPNPKTSGRAKSKKNIIAVLKQLDEPIANPDIADRANYLKNLLEDFQHGTVNDNQLTSELKRFSTPLRHQAREEKKTEPAASSASEKKPDVKKPNITSIPTGTTTTEKKEEKEAKPAIESEDETDTETETESQTNEDAAGETPETRSSERERVPQSRGQQEAAVNAPSATIRGETPNSAASNLAPSSGAAPGIELPNIPATSISTPSLSIPTPPTINIPTANTTIAAATPVTAAARQGSASIAQTTQGATQGIAELQQIHQQIANVMSAIEQEKDLAGKRGEQYQMQMADLRRQIGKIQQANPSPAGAKTLTNATNVSNALRQARMDTSDVGAKNNLQQSINASRTELELPTPILAQPEPTIIASPAGPSIDAPTLPSFGGFSASAPVAAGSIRTGIPSETFQAPTAPAPTTPRLRFGQAGPRPSRPLPTLSPGEMSAALEAAQQAARYSGGAERGPLSGDTRLSDTPVSEGGAAGSVLDTGRDQPSYAFQNPDIAPPIAGGESGGGFITSVPEEAERMRRLSEQQQRNLEAFAPVQAPSAIPLTVAGGTLAGGGAPSTQTARFPTAAPAPEEEEEDTEAEDEEDQAAQLDAQQQQQANTDRQNAQIAAQEQMKEAKAATKKKILDYIKAGDGALSIETVAITLLINLAIWNIQGINKYLFKSEMIPDQHIGEDFCCVTCDLMMCINWLFSPPCFIGPVIIIFGTMAYYLTKIQGVIPHG